MSAYRTITLLPDDFDLEELLLLEEPKAITVPVGPPGATGPAGPAGAGTLAPEAVNSSCGVSTFDCGDTIRAMLAAHGRVDLTAGRVYYFTGTITIEAGQLGSGAGGSAAGVNAALSTLRALDSSAMVWVRGAGAQLKNIAVDGNNVATVCVKVGGTGTGDVGTSPVLENVTAMQAAAGGKNFWISGAQNGVAIGCNALNSGGDNWSFTDHAGGWVLVRCEGTGAAGYNLHGNASGNVEFIGCIFERGTSGTNPSVLFDGAVWYPHWRMFGCTLASGGVFASGSSVGTGLALSASADTITKTAHGMFTGQAVSLSNIVTATGVSAGVQYWVLNPTANTFQLTATQYGTTPVNITADGTADVTKFVRYLLEHRGNGTVEVDSGAWAGIATEAGILVSGTGAKIALTGVHTVTHTILAGNTTPGQAGGMVALIDGDSSAVILGPEHQVQGQAVPIGPIPIHTSNLPTGNIGLFPPTASTVNRTLASLRAFASYVNGDTVVRFEQLVDGTLKWSSGSASADAVMARNGVGSLFLTGALTGSSTIGAPGWRYARLDHTASADGTITLDATTVDLHHVFMAGHNVTLAISGGTVGQSLYVYVQQSASPGTLTLPLQASGVFWTGTDAGKPPLTSASGWLTFVLECVSAGVWIERGRGGTNVVLGATGVSLILTDVGVKTAAYTASANQLVRGDTTSAGFTVTLPTAPADGTRIIVKKIDSSANALGVACGGSDVLNKSGGSTSVSLAYQNASVALQYVASGGIWVITSTDAGAGVVHTDTGLLKANNLSDVASAPTALGNLGGAPLASPTFTGTPAAPTPSAGDNSTKLATTAYVDTLGALKAPLASPALTGNPTAPTQSANDNSTKVATTAYVDTPLALKAPLASPALTGSPTVPTQTQNDNSTKAASTAYADRAALAVKGRKELALAAAGLVTENFFLETASGGLTPVSGTRYGCLVGVLAGDVATNLCVAVSTAGSGTAPTLIKLGLADPSGNIVALTADVHSSAAWTSNGIAQIPLTAPYTIPTSGGYRVVLIKVGTFGTTDVVLAKGANLAAAAMSAAIGSGIPKMATYGTGQTDLPSVSSALPGAGTTVTNFWVGIT